MPGVKRFSRNKCVGASSVAANWVSANVPMAKVLATCSPPSSLRHKRLRAANVRFLRFPGSLPPTFNRHGHGPRARPVYPPDIPDMPTRTETAPNPPAPTPPTRTFYRFRLPPTCSPDMDKTSFQTSGTVPRHPTDIQPTRPFFSKIQRLHHVLSAQRLLAGVLAHLRPPSVTSPALQVCFAGLQTARSKSPGPSCLELLSQDCRHQSIFPYQTCAET